MTAVESHNGIRICCERLLHGRGQGLVAFAHHLSTTDNGKPGLS